MKRNPLAITLFAIISSSAHSAEVVDLSLNSATAKRLGTPNLETLTGLTRNELVPRAGSPGKTNVTRYVQYYKGVPILGRPIVAEAVADTFSAPLQFISGTILRQLENDLPSLEPMQSKDSALAIAQANIRDARVTEEQAYLYIDSPADSKARLVYIVDLTTESNNKAGRTSFLIDAADGNVLDRWDSSTTKSDGPGGSLAPVIKSLATLGWKHNDIDALLAHSQSVYWTENASFVETGCGTISAALALGFNTDDVRLAFQQPGKCRSNERSSQTEDGSASATTEVVQFDELSGLAKPKLETFAKYLLPTKYSAYRKFTIQDALAIPALDTGDDWWNRLQSNTGTTHHSTGAIYANTFLANVLSQGGRLEQQTIDYCARFGDCVDMRLKQNIERTFGALVDKRDTRFSGASFKNTRSSNTAANELYPYAADQFYVENAVTHSRSVSVTTQLSIGATMNFTDYAGISAEVSLSRGVTNENGAMATVGTNIPRKKLTVRPGCQVIVYVNEMYEPAKDAWQGIPEFRGSVSARGYRPGVGERQYRFDAATFLQNNQNAFNATVNLKKNLAFGPVYVYSKLRSNAVNCNLF